MSLFLVDKHRLPPLKRGITQRVCLLSPTVKLISSRNNHLIFLSLKGKEFKIKITADQAKGIFNQSDLKFTRIRYLIKLDSVEWYIDFFQEKDFALASNSILKNEKRPLWIAKQLDEEKINDYWLASGPRTL